MRLAVMVPVVIPHQYQEAAIESLLAQQGIELELLIIRNSPEVEDFCAKYEGKPGVTLLRTESNIGVAASWNEGCRFAFSRGLSHACLFADDFILQTPKELRGLATLFEAKGEGLFVFHGHGFGSFAVSRKLWETTGDFDEGFWPGGYEDMDYLRRIRGFNVHESCLQASHITGPVVYKGTWLDELMQVAGKLNGARFVYKWGGHPKRCLFDKPWNGRAPTVKDTRKIMEELGIIDAAGRLVKKVRAVF